MRDLKVRVRSCIQTFFLLKSVDVYKCMRICVKLRVRQRVTQKDTNGAELLSMIVLWILEILHRLADELLGSEAAQLN